MSLDNQSLPPDQYSAYHPGVFATPPVRTPHNKSGKHTLEYTVKDSLIHPDIVLNIQVEFGVHHYPGGEIEYEFIKPYDPLEIVQVNWMHVRGCEFYVTQQQQAEAIKLAWDCVHDGSFEDLKEKCLESVRG